ncbi:NUDIX domain-containing protein [Herbiconiux sp. KACC 21604]|uniref:NUDIX domain-containing protein n=1 Tax=Herbiconiux sp. A18JL235 TaxID=3152363 RepID=A0AB39BIS8_9MICO|nr:NUDIX domain-containing protein [Herbiconiux sp. SALV-R1]QJU54909.1 NUDIX domain-containing protein [Herbiconiux sp. SALV-R1]WPO86033.1 NUDIX domain-containing protein [Herbiconiux sp. KACC 21604]
MATPDFVLELREKIGHAPLWLTGVTAVVVRGDEVLLVRRSDNGAWTPVTGIVDPGEEPAIAAVREVLEEADIHAKAQHLAWVHVIPTIVYPNGDVSQYLDITFRLSYVSGEPFPADGENTDVRWFPLDALPEMSDEMHARIRHALDGVEAARFVS